MYNDLKSLGIIQLPCSKTVKVYMSQRCKSPGIIENDLLLNSKKYNDYIKERKISEYLSPKGQGVLICNETKIIHFTKCMKLKIK